MTIPRFSSVLFAILMPFSACKAQTVIDAQFTPDIGGIKQVVEIKTDDANKPALLFLSGGPGSSMMNNASAYTQILKSTFTIVQWDQRDAGKTLKLNRSPGPLSVAQMQNDTLEVIDFIRKELKQEKIVLLGSSWGNVLGFHVVATRPEVLHAYFAVNPVISQLASEQELLSNLKDHFKADPVAASELARVRIPFTADEDLFFLRKWLFHKDGKAYALTDGFKTGFLQWSRTWSPVWNDVMRIDLPKSLKQVAAPVHFFVGANDIQTSTRITEQYFQAVKAPKKSLTLFEKSGHQIHHDEAEKFQNAIIKTWAARTDP